MKHKTPMDDKKVVYTITTVFLVVLAMAVAHTADVRIDKNAPSYHAR